MPGDLGTEARAKVDGWSIAVAILLLAGGGGVLGAGHHVGRLDEPVVLVAATAALVLGMMLLALVAADGPARRREARHSAELATLSRRLLASESAASPAGERERPDPGGEAEIAADVATLSRLVLRLAEALDEQDGILRTLSADPRRSAGPSAAIASDPALVFGEDPGLTPAEGDEALRRQNLAVSTPLAAPSSQDGSFELHVHTVVTLPQRRPYLLQAMAFVRLDDGDLIPRAEAPPALDRLGHGDWLEAELLGALEQACHLPSDGGAGAILVPLGPAADSLARSLTVLGPLLGGNPDLSGRIVLSRPLAVWRSAWSDEADAFAHIRGLGVALCVEDDGEAGGDWPALAARGVAFLKVAAADLLADEAAQRRAAEAAGAGIRVIATDVRHERDIPDLIEQDVALASGDAFDAPRPVRSARPERGARSGDTSGVARPRSDGLFSRGPAPAGDRLPRTDGGEAIIGRR